jgi:putative tryptophan/tyrosine transport system substrate-binding protein
LSSIFVGAIRSTDQPHAQPPFASSMKFNCAVRMLSPDEGRGMRRREFLGIVSVAAAWPIAARAQQLVSRIGYVWIGAKGTDAASGAGLRQGLADKGYVIGQNLILEERYADGDIEKVPALIADLLALKVSLLVTVGTSVSLMAKHATSTVPIVSASGDPVGSGLVASLARPGGNVTGFSLLSSDYSAKWLALLKELVPNLHRVAVLGNPDNPSIAKEIEQLRAAARTLAIELTALSSKSQDIEASFAAISNGGFEGLVVTTEAFLEPLIRRIIALAGERRLPAIYPFSSAVEQGGLMSYSADIFGMWRRAASYVDRILKGERPGDLPIEQPTTVALKINLKTAKALGLHVPPSLIVAADEVIE